jgi:hypothetical protein
LDTIVGLIVEARPSSLLDIGVGFGKYGVLAREYLELWQDDEHYHQWRTRIDGVEVHADYLTPLHDFVYDKVYVGNALTVLPDLDCFYDLILLVDVLEHFEFDEGRSLLRSCAERGRNLIVSTPADDTEQSTRFENPHEQHRSHWTARDLKDLPGAFFVTNRSSLICFSGENAPEVGKSFKRHRATTAFREGLPALNAASRRIKQARRAWRKPGEPS